ncbi:cyclodeaminase/cyclohydrolase family protein [Clostridium algidicarnis]|uniref:cyclodeaminase/cyclohydrolase family protein n=1 Tax=Clostridium algidicarnis TaxID=37659 RepID=UPI000495EEDD|nr:cyclodeaminase/cyclohydrolase family protein [Clostridium algidicarnis]MBB6631228.1 cyclodeaminase/cyclohydrolase family protein [Clostridium algidicarnis]MBB6696120.1 cyclodeaminase/cyclohydrolase family protein [Clostridium algidicarnis]MBU3193860.1 cyclodeaminase/cyclohydrolase family protein [Clostridium algidicarnis]MBU3203259.1 cyclodeaminase/cyclohydrolase family protein [Clostridium algidicarnis]MBU3211413.1 cyclodeaminase/cyclohydrolase family protein [Clostridium algidicarnis]
MLKELTVENFAKELASKSPAPGGGSAAALSATLAASLSSMVFNLTIGKKAYENLKDEEKECIINALKKTEVLREEYLDIMQEDTTVFLKVMDAYKMPKDSEDEKNLRKIKIEEAYKLALEVPRRLSEKCFELYKYIEIAAKYGNANAISDAGVSALMIQAALEGASLNVKINLASLEDIKLKETLLKETNTLIKEGSIKKDAILKIVENKIGA